MRIIEPVSRFFQQVSKRGLLSLMAILTCMIFVVEHSYESNKWGKDQIVIDDAIMYYGYLPGVFIFQDITFDFLTSGDDPRKEGIKIWVSENEHGKRFLKMPAGESVMLTPFFLVSHWVAKANGERANGYSPTYYYGIALAAWVYLFLGLLLIRSFLRKLQFKDVSIALTVFILVLGTNLFHYSALEPGVSHVYSFFLFALVLYLTISISTKVTALKMLALGAALGLVAITRPTNLLVALVPMLYGVYSWKTLKAKFRLIPVYWKQLLFAGFGFGVFAFIQPLLWKLGTGEWIVYSYNNEKLFFNDPQIYKFLFSYRKGAFLYYPILMLAFVGMFVSLKKYKKLQIPILIFSILNIYVIASWWCWWYGGSLGARPLVESYALFALTFTILIDRIISKFTFVPIVVIVVLATRLNFFYEEKFVYTFLHYDSMTKAAYWELMTKSQLTGEYWDLLERPCTASRLQGKSEEEPLVTNYFSIEDTVLDTVEFPSPSFEIDARSFFKYATYSEILVNGALSVDSVLQEDEQISVVVSLHNYESDISYLYQSWTINNDSLVAPKKWQPFKIKCPMQPVGDHGAILKVYVWNQSGQMIRVRDMDVVHVVY